MKEYLLVTLVALVVTYITTPLVRRLAIRARAVTPVRARDVHTTPTPRWGGLAILIGFLAAVAVAGELPHLGCVVRPAPDVCGPAAGGEIRGIVVGALLVAVVGAIDDVRELDWLTKLSGQIIAAAAMAYAGVQLLSVPLFGVTVLPPPVLMALTILIVLVTTNAVNFIDGLDGLAAGVVAIAGSAFFLYVYGVTRLYESNVFSTSTLVSAALVGGCLGFLPHNFHHARLFMGDAGALLLGLLLAGSTITFVGNIDPAAQVGGNATLAAYLPVLLPLAVMALPLVDMVLAVVRRTRRGQTPWSPDAQHLQHRMLQIGHGHTSAVLLLYLWAAIGAFGGVALAYFSGPWPVVGIFAAVVLASALTRLLPRAFAARAR